MALVFLVIFFGPFLSKMLCPTHLSSSETLGFAIANIIFVALWALIIVGLEKVITHWVVMIVAWLGILILQGCFFSLAIHDTKFGDSMAEFTAEIFRKKRKPE